MNKIFRNRLSAAAVIVVCFGMYLATSVCFAESEPGRKGKGEVRFLKGLNLTEEQEAKLAEFRKKEMPERKEAMEAMQSSRKKLMEELGKSKSDTKEIERLSAEVKRLQGQMLDSYIKSISNMKEVLTPEQFQKFQEKTKEKHGKFKKGRAKAMGRSKECAKEKETE